LITLEGIPSWALKSLAKLAAEFNVQIADEWDKRYPIMHQEE
jgi:hypothetical protein